MTKLGVEMSLSEFTGYVSLEIVCAKFVIPECMYDKLVLKFSYWRTCGNDKMGSGSGNGVAVYLLVVSG